MRKYEYYYERKAKLESYKPIENIDNIVMLVVSIPAVLFMAVIYAIGSSYK